MSHHHVTFAAQSITAMKTFPINMHLGLPVFLLFLAVIVSPGQQQPTENSLISGVLRKSGLPEGQASVTIPLSLTFSGFTLEVQINGELVDLILDTGASSIVLNKEVADRIGLEIREDNDITTRDITGAEVETWRASTERINLGDAWTENEPVRITELPPGTHDGLLGLSTLADWDFRIHPIENTLTLFRSGEADQLEGETAIPLDCTIVNSKARSSNPQGFRTLNLKVPVQVDGHAVAATLDTGYGRTLLLPSTLMNKFAPEAMNDALPALVQTITASGGKATRTAKVPEFTLGSDTLRDLPTEVVDTTPGTEAELHGVIGLNLLRHYVMTFCLSKGELRLKPIGTVQDITRSSTAGLRLAHNEHGRIVILSVVPDGPGSKVGIQAGDELLEIEGRSLESMKPAEFAAFKQLPPGTILSVRYRRGEGTPVTATLELVKQ